MNEEEMRLTLKNKTYMLDTLAKALDDLLREMYGERIGFALFMFPWAGEGEAGDYVSNGTRETMIKFMRELADRLEEGQEIGRPIGEA